ncbi:MAG TPA: hypothetical protein VH325_14480 [Bryobacteraceae bacterium]|jgi:hypothetical protein|nr:hypothetical protein [Bryobacteraceae bacterium]
MAGLWANLIGVTLVAWTLREIFIDLFQPSGAGDLSSLVGRQLFRVARRFPLMMPVAGPLSIVVVISSWPMLLAVGFALIYWPYFPQAFVGSAVNPQSTLGKFWSVLYFSLASLTTLAASGITPRGSWISVVSALESLIGTSLITASVTWIVLIYPALGRMRALARRASILLKAQEQTKIDVVSDDVEHLLGDLANGVIRTRVDFIHFPLIYYFHAGTDKASLAKSLIQLQRFADSAVADERPERVRLSAAVLKIALAEIAELLAKKFVRKADPRNPATVFHAMAKEHLEDK